MARWKKSGEEEKREAQSAPEPGPRVDPPPEKEAPERELTELDRLLMTREQIDERIAAHRYEAKLMDLRERIVAEINRKPRPPGMILHALSLIEGEVRENDVKARRGGG